MQILASLSLLALLAGGMWMAIGLGFAGLFVLYFFGGGTMAFPIATMGVWNMLYSFPLVALPLFILLGELFIKFDLSIRVYNALTPLMDRFPGKLLLSNVLLCAVFGATSGSSMATAATVGSVAYPELRNKGYDRRTLVGNLAGSGTLGILVPPSIPIIIYASLTNVSVGASFVASVVPALLALSFFVAYIVIHARLRPHLIPASEPTPLSEAMRGLAGILPIALLVIAVMGTIYFGVGTVTEAAAIGVLATVLIAVGYRTFSFRRVGEALIGTALVCATIGFIMMGAMIFSMALAAAGVPRFIVGYVNDLGLSPIVLLMSIYVFYIALGCFLGATEMLVTTLPFTFPLVMALGYDPVWFAVVVVILCEMGQITPPVGFNLYVLQSITKGETTLGEVAGGAFPYLVMLGLLLVLVTIFPQLCTFLPTTM